VLRGMLIGFLPDGNKYSYVRIDPMQTPQRQPCADLAGVPDPPNRS
jgi:hypothetical protein